MSYNISKRTLAREYLILILSIVLIVLSYVILKLYIKHETSKIDEQIAIIAKELKSKKEIERFNFFNAFNNNFPNNYTYSKFWERLEKLAEKDSIKVKWEEWNSEVVSFNKKMGYSTDVEFRSFILSNTFTPKEIVQRERIDSKIEELKVQKNFIENNNYFNDKFIIILITILFVFYPFRFLLKGLKWSLKNLSQNN